MITLVLSCLVFIGAMLALFVTVFLAVCRGASDLGAVSPLGPEVAGAGDDGGRVGRDG
jgi:hypothetical protein